MQKAQFISLVRNQLAGGDASDESLRFLNTNIIERQIEIALEQVLLGQGFVGSIPYWKLDALTKPYTVSIECDNTRNQYYVDMPAATMILSNNQQIRDIISVGDPNALFMPRAGNMRKLNESLYANSVGDFISYMLEGNRLWFGNRMPNKDGSLILQLVVKFSEWGDDEEVNIPADKVQQVIVSVIQIMGARPKEDAINDNAN